MLKGIMNNSVGRAGQMGYVVKGGDVVILQPATNLPSSSNIAYFAARDDGMEYFIGISDDDVRVIVDWEDIEGCVEPDDWDGRAPWDDCEGWEHDTRELGYYDDDGLTDSRGYARIYNDPNVLIEIDDDDIINRWGCTRRNGEAKQVWLERVAQDQTESMDQLVKWYEDGWCSWYAEAKYDDYHDGLGGIYADVGDDYLDECVLECRYNVAAEMEDAGYIVNNKPAPPEPYNHVKEFKDHICRNLDMS